MSKEKMVKSRNLTGEAREYYFKLMDTKTGFQILHEFAAEYHILSPMIVDHIGKAKEKVDAAEFDLNNLPQAALELIQFFPMILSWEKLEQINGHILKDATAKMGDAIVKFDDKGFADIEPLESYLALLHGIAANYESLLPPLLNALVVSNQDGDTSQGDGQTTDVN